jgi:hypothetical protein
LPLVGAKSALGEFSFRHTTPPSLLAVGLHQGPGPDLGLVFQLESLNLSPGLRCLDNALMDPMWNNYDKLLIFDQL